MKIYNIRQFFLSKNVLEFVLITTVVMCFNMIIKYYFATSNAMFQDDLVGLPNAIDGVLISTSSKLYLHVSHLLGSVVKVKIFWLLLLSVAGGSTYALFREYFTYKYLLALVVILGFAGVSAIEMGNHIMGSSVLWSYIVLVVYCILLTKHKDNELMKYGLMALSLMLGFVYSSVVSSYSIILAYSAIFIFFVDRPFNFRYLIYYSLFILPSTVPLLMNIFSGQNVSHYADLGWISFRPNDMIGNIPNYFLQVCEYVFFYTDNAGYLGFFQLLLILLLLLLVTIYFFRVDMCNLSSLTINSKALLLFMFASFILSLLPILALQRSLADRYLMLPTLFLLLIIFYILDMMFKSLELKSKYYYFPVLAVIFAFVALNLYSSIIIQHVFYNRSAFMQNIIEEFIKDSEREWTENSQIILVLSDMPPNFTMGYNHWSTGFIQYAAQRKDLTGIIGLESWLTDYPMVEKFRWHGPEYWKEIDGSDGIVSSSRKRMVGIEICRPTYAYFLDMDTMIAYKYSYICIKRPGGEQLFEISEEGFHYTEGTCTDLDDNILTYSIESDFLDD